MHDKFYHIERLKPEVENKIRKLLHEGSDEVIRILHEHFKSYNPNDSENFFEKVLIQVATTTGKVASLKQLHFGNAKSKRIAFLPGYTTKAKKRVAHKTKFKSIVIPSDIALNIKSVEQVEKAKDAYTNQAVLYYYLLEDHKDDDGFSNGGTHQFLIENVTTLTTTSKYHIDLLKVFADKMQSDKESEITFLSIKVDFAVQNTIEKLFTHFDDALNKDNPDKRWPASVEDTKGDSKKKQNVFKMRGYLVALWYKVLHDKNPKDLDTWFKDCKAFAESNGFNRLSERLSALKSSLKKDGEHYTYWYSLVFNPLPDFTTSGKPRKETIGSAMLMTDFELKPQFFFWIQPWINRIYRYIRDFETSNELTEKVIREVSNLRSIYSANDKYLPRKAQGDTDRLYKAAPSHKHKKELIYYYQEFFGTKSEDAIEKHYRNAISLVNATTLIHLIQKSYTIIPPELNSLIKTYSECIDNILPDRKLKYNAVLREHTDPRTMEIFKNRLIGRMSTLLFYCTQKLSVEHIHAIHFSSIKDINAIFGARSKNAFGVLRSSFFIEGVETTTTDFLRKQSIQKVKESVSPYEKEFIENFRTQFDTFLSDISAIHGHITTLQSKYEVVFW